MRYGVVAGWLASVMLLIAAFAVMAFACAACVGAFYWPLTSAIPVVLACCWSLDWIERHA